MSDQSKISKDKEAGYPKYKQIEQFGEEHTPDLAVIIKRVNIMKAVMVKK